MHRLRVGGKKTEKTFQETVNYKKAKQNRDSYTAVPQYPQGIVFRTLARILKSKDTEVPYIKWLQFSRSVMSNSLQPHGLQHARPPHPSPTPRVYPNSCP